MLRVSRCVTMLSLREHGCLGNVGTKLKADAQADGDADGDADADADADAV